MSPEPTQQTTFRLPISLLARLDHLATTMTRTRPGITVTRADVVRMLLLRGLEAVDGEGEVTP